MGTHENCLGEAVLTSIHNICLEQKLCTPLNPSFTIYKLGVKRYIYKLKRYILYEYVILTIVISVFRYQ